MAPIVCTYRTIFLIAPQALQVLGMKPNTKDISINFSRKKPNQCKNLLCTFSLFCHFDCHYLLNNYSSGTLMAMMLRTRIEISWLKCLSLPWALCVNRDHPIWLDRDRSDFFLTVLTDFKPRNIYWARSV